MCALLGCSAFTLHDESRAKLAADGKQLYADSKVTEVLQADRKNLELILAEEIKTVQENQRIQVDYALLAVANNSTPMADTYEEGLRRLKELGFDSPKAMRALLKGNVDTGQTRRTLQSFAKVFREAGVAPPDCERLPHSLELPATLPDSKKARLKAIYPQYEKLCKALKEPSLPPEGQVTRAYGDWVDAQRSAEESKKRAAELRQEVASAKTAYDQAVQKGLDPKVKADERAKDVEQASKKLAGALSKAQEANLGIENDERIGALVQLLTATAGGDINTTDVEVKKAALVAKQIPSLTRDIGELESRRTAPPVSGLLIALRHQTLLADAAKNRTTLADERVAILKARYDAYYQEAERWLRFLDAMCSYAVLGEFKRDPGSECDDFQVQVTSSPPQTKCQLKGASLPNCALGTPWKARMNVNESGPVKRELYKALAAYLQALGLQVLPREESFREIDVRHRETLLAKQSALEAWDNAIGVPLEQLDAYYKAGVRPAELADLIVKALGFTAIAIGVAQ